LKRDDTFRLFLFFFPTGTENPALVINIKLASELLQ